MLINLFDSKSNDERDILPLLGTPFVCNMPLDAFYLDLISDFVSTYERHLQQLLSCIHHRVFDTAMELFEEFWNNFPAVVVEKFRFYMFGPMVFADHRFFKVCTIDLSVIVM